MSKKSTAAKGAATKSTTSSTKVQRPSELAAAVLKTKKEQKTVADLCDMFVSNARSLVHHVGREGTEFRKLLADVSRLSQRVAMAAFESEVALEKAVIALDDKFDKGFFENDIRALGFVLSEQAETVLRSFYRNEVIRLAFLVR